MKRNRRRQPDGAANDFTYNGVGQLLTDVVNKASMQWTPPMIMSDNYAANNLNQYSTVNGATLVHDEPRAKARALIIPPVCTGGAS